MKQKDFFIACKTGNIQEIERALVPSLFNCVGINKKNNEGETALIIAVQDGNIDICELLIKRGANINLKDNSKFTALIYATMGNKTEIIQILLNNGAEINVNGRSGMTALHWAADIGSKETCKLLIINGSNVNIKDETGKTPLDKAYFYVQYFSRGQFHDYRLKNYMDICNLLLDNGAKPIKKS